MAKKFEKKLLSSAVALALGAGFSAGAQAIQVSEDAVGQVLMAPIYFADLGYATQVTIVNTRSDVAVKARVGLRSRVNSIEFDFICYMTPSDVCRFNIENIDGQAYVTSTDDSILADAPSDGATYTPVFASECATKSGAFCKNGRFEFQVYDVRLPINQGGLLERDADIRHFPNITAEAHPSNPDSNEIGHLEVTGIWGARGTIIYNQVNGVNRTVTVKEGMSKHDLYKIFGPIVEGQRQNRGRLAAFSADQNEALWFADGRLDAAGVCQVVPALNAASDVNTANHGAPCWTDITGATQVLTDTNASKLRSTDPSWIQLTGSLEMNSYTDRMGIQMAALDGDIWDNLETATHAPAYGMYSYSPSVDAGASAYAFDGRVISNPSYELETTETMNLGVNFGQSRAGYGEVLLAYDNIIEIENALAAASLVGSYENDGKNFTNLIVTFPTKYRHMSQDAQRPLTYPGRVTINPLGNDFGDVCASEWVAPLNDDGELHGRVDLFDGLYYYPPFRPESSGSVQYGMSVLNDQEQRPGISVNTLNPFSGGGVDAPAALMTITDEVNYMWVNWPKEAGFTSGWFTLGLTPTAGCQYTGVPVLAYAHKTQVVSGQLSNSWMVPLAQDPKKSQ